MRVGQKVMKQSSLSSQQFNATDLIKKILSNYVQQNDDAEEQHVDWERMREDVAHRFAATPSCLFFASE
jgi:hypothetical protein